MDSFRWIVVPLSLVLGLGIARLLTSGVALFQSRRQAKLDWIPPVWAACIFLWQIQFWWSLIELSGTRQSWAIGHFLTLLALVLLLFVAAALVLPSEKLTTGSDLRESFRQDGRWALLFLSVYFALAAVADWLLWEVPVVSLVTAEQLLLALLPLVYLSLPWHSARVATTVVFVLASLWLAWDFSPDSY